VNVAASLEVVQGLKLLLGREEDINGDLFYVDVWKGTWERFETTKSDTPCLACDLGRFDFLEGTKGSHPTGLCGREAVQVNMRGERRISFPALAERLGAVGEVSFNDYMLRFQVGPYELIVFPDGRTIVKGTADEAAARTICAKYIGL